MRVAHLGDVAQVDRTATPGGHDDILDLGDALKLPLRSEQDLVLPLLHRTDGAVLVLRAQDIDDLVDGEVVGAQLLGLQLDLDLPAEPTANVDCGNTGHPLDPRLDILFEQGSQFTGVHIGRDRQEHDRKLVGVELEDGRGQNIFGEGTPDAIDAGPNLVRRFVEIDVVIELDPHVARPFRRGRADPVDARGRAERRFHRTGHQVLDLFRCDSSVVGSDGQRRVLNLWHEIDGQSREGDCTEEHDDGHHHIDGDGTANGDTW